MNLNNPAPVRTTAEKFPDAAHVPSSSDLWITPHVLAHALFVSGRAPGHRHRHGRSSTYEFIHRIAAMPAYLRWTRKGIKRTDLALELDPTEKGMLSYTLGQAMCQVFAEHLLSLRFFMHVSRYADTYGLTFPPGQSRADFFGPRYSGTWVVAEAKGRSGRLDKETRQAMEAQKRTVKTVSGQVPEISYASAVDFPSKGGAMRLTAIDPEEAEPGAVDLPVNLDQFALAYYTPFLDAFAHQQPQLLGDYVVVGFESVRVTLGLLAPVLQRIERAVHLEDTSGLYGDVTRLLDRYTTRFTRETTTLYADGTLFAADWNHRPDLLRRESPQPDAEQMQRLHEFYRMVDVQDDPSRDEWMREEDWNWRSLSLATGALPGIFPPVDVTE
ncbi:hypothetical protein [Streptomyces sp. NPDC005752]|uniref:hypothetical protein n=1 Tax=Streptomyces sp. NPDC005752 TaxID=3157065 RepID=UPI0033FB8CF2